MKFQHEELFRQAQRAHRKRDFVKAGSLYARFVQLNPGTVEAWEALAAILIELGNLAGAEECLSGIVRFGSDYPYLYRIHSQLCRIYNSQGRTAAVEHGREAVRLNPQDEVSWLNLVDALERTGQYDEAISCCDQLQALGSKRHCEAQYLIKRGICAWDGIEELERAIADPADQTLNLGYLAMPSTTAAKQLQGAQIRAKRYPARYIHNPGVEHHVRDRRIRLGYIGNEFHNTPTMVCLASTIENHDRERFEVHGFSFGPEHDVPLRQRLRKGFDRFHDVRALPSEAIARQIKLVGIDVLIDLCGYIKDNRAEVMARRPAPVQISYIGWPATMGAPFIDYLVADRTVAPDPAMFSEKLLYLDCYLPTDDRKPEPKTPERRHLGLPEDAIVLCAMNNAWKITPSMMELWCEVLRELPNAVLWLVVRYAAAERNLSAFAKARGVDSRIIFIPDVAYEEHLNRISAADLALDTFPYGGHSTTTDLLWAGVPVVTCRGETFASRVATSLLNAGGVPELSTSSLAEYKALILALCRDKPRLASLKAQLNATRSSSRLFDNKSYTKAFEARLIELVT